MADSKSSCSGGIISGRAGRDFHRCCVIVCGDLDQLTKSGSSSFSRRAEYLHGSSVSRPFQAHFLLCLIPEEQENNNSSIVFLFAFFSLHLFLPSSYSFCPPRKKSSRRLKSSCPRHRQVFPVVNTRSSRTNAINIRRQPTYLCWYLRCTANNTPSRVLKRMRFSFLPISGTAVLLGVNHGACIVV